MRNATPQKERVTPLSADTFSKLGLSVIAAVFGGLLLWSIVAPIDSAVIAAGQVAVESNRKTVQHLEGGVVKDIRVREGQVVTEGETVIQLDDTLANANLSLIDNQLSELYAQRARLLAERDGGSDFPTPKGVEEVLSRPAFAAVYEGQKEFYAARLATQQRLIALLEERITQQEIRIQGLQAQRQSIRSQLRLINDELESVRSLYDKGFAPLTRLRSLERESERLSGERGALTAGLAEANSIIAEGRLDIERLKETAREEAIAELREVSASIAELEERRIAAAHVATHMDIKAPQTGQVIGLSAHTVGGVIAPGDTIMDIVPVGDRLEVAARVSPIDIDKVREGQDALVRFTAFSARNTPETIGKVRTVSADSLIDPTSGIAYYLVLIDLPQPEELASLLSGESLVPGMPADIYIKTGRQPAISYLLRPLTDALARSMREN